MTSTPSPRKIGIIAGHGSLAQNVVQACQQQGDSYFVCAFDGQTDRGLLHLGNNTKPIPHAWFQLGQVGKVVSALNRENITHIVMAGYFTRPDWKTLRPDFKGLSLISKFMGKPLGDDALFRILIDFFETEGFQVISPEDILGEQVLIEAGVLTTAQPDEQALVDIKRGLEVGKALGRVDVGQSVVVQQGLVLGVEALEGSDNLIRRTTDLKRPGLGGVFVKVIKPQQDTRVDRSVIGPQTVIEAANAGLRGIAAEAKSVMLLQKDKTIALANEHGLFIAGV